MSITINQIRADVFTVHNSATQDTFSISPSHTTRSLSVGASSIGLTNEETGKVAAVISGYRPGVVAAQLGIAFSITPQ